MRQVIPGGGGSSNRTKGSTNIRPVLGTGEITKSRYNNPDATYAEATNSCTWTEEENVTEIVITLFGDLDTTTSDHGWVVVDAINSAAAVTLLGAAGGAAVDVQKIPLKYGEPTVITGTSYLTRIDVDLTDNAVMFVEAQ